MTRHDTDQVIYGYAEPRGTGEGNWVSRRYRALPQAEPVRDTWRDHLRDALTILAPLAVLALLSVGLWLWVAILSVAVPNV